MDSVNLGVPREEKMEHGENEGGLRPMGPIDQSDEIVYPHFHYCGPLDLELPDNGKMLVEFVKRKETSYVEKDGKHWYECKVEIRTIEKVNGKQPEAYAPAKSLDASSAALDKLAREMSEAQEEGEDEEDEDSEGY